MNLRLLTPGPVPVPDFVQQALARPPIHHRSAAFEGWYAGLLGRARYLFQAESAAVLALIGSGTYGVSAAMYSLFRPGDEVLVLVNGKFSRRWAEYGTHIGLRVALCEVPWGDAPTMAQVVAAAHAHPQAQGVVLTHCETTTAAATDVEAIAQALRRQFPDLCLLVDGVSSIGAMPFYMDAWGIDAAVVASQKALMNPTGTCLLALGPRALARLRPTHAADFLNLHNYWVHAQRGSYPYSPPVQALYGLEAAIDHLHRQGLPVVWNHVHGLAAWVRQELTHRGFKLLANTPADALTAFCSPEADYLHAALMARGIQLAEGQEHVAGHVLRVSHLGSVGMDDMRAFMAALDEARALE